MGARCILVESVNLAVGSGGWASPTGVNGLLPRGSGVLPCCLANSTSIRLQTLRSLFLSISLPSAPFWFWTFGFGSICMSLVALCGGKSPCRYFELRHCASLKICHSSIPPKKSDLFRFSRSSSSTDPFIFIVTS